METGTSFVSMIYDLKHDGQQVVDIGHGRFFGYCMVVMQVTMVMMR